MFEEEKCEERKTYLKIDIEGANDQLWQQLKLKLTALILGLLETPVNNKTGGDVKEEFKRIGTNLIEYANAKLEKASIENQKMLAEIDLALATKEKTLSEARKIDAETEKLRIENTLDKLKLSLSIAKIVTSQNADETTIAFIKNIEDFIFMFNENRVLEK